MLMHTTVRKNKLEATWVGPYVVVGTINPVVYVLERCGSGTHMVVHASCLKLFLNTQDLGPTTIKDEAEYVGDAFIPEAALEHR